MTQERMQLEIIIGSTRRGRFGPTAANWFATQARQHGEFDIDRVDLAETHLPDTLTDHAEARPQPVEELAPRIAAADAFIVVTPEYNHSFPAPLKTAIDWYREEWHAKPVGFVSYGGISGGLRSVEQLRLVFAEMHAVTIRETVSFHQYPNCFDADGTPIDADGVAQAAKKMLDQLAWWGHALRNHRTHHPYDG